MTKTQAKRALADRTKVEAGQGDDHDIGHIVEIDAGMAIVAWSNGTRTPCPLADLAIVS
jgi:hypothetical protein